MTDEAIQTLLETAGLPVAYGCFRAPRPLPYLVWLEAYCRPFAADGRVWCGIRHIQVELYTDRNDPELEGSVERALSSFVWEKTKEWLESEKCFQVLYEFEV